MTRVVRGAIPATTTIVSVSAGLYHSLILGDDGFAYGWGNNGSGAVGDGTNTNAYSPVQVSLGQMPSANLVSVSANQWASFGVTADGKIYAWGAAWNAQIGNGSSDVNSPIPVAQGEIPAGVTFTSVSHNGTDYQTLALGSDGNIYGWGMNNVGQVGSGSATVRIRTPQKVAPAPPTLTPASQTVTVTVGSAVAGIRPLRTVGVAGAPSYSVAPALPAGLSLDAASGAVSGVPTATSASATYTITVTGAVSGRASAKLTLSVVAAAGPSRFSSVALGASHTLAVGADGWAYAWGKGANGQLANGSTASAAAPTPILRGAVPVGVRIVQVAAGATASLALGSDGYLYSWDPMRSASWGWARGRSPSPSIRRPLSASPAAPSRPTSRSPRSAEPPTRSMRSVAIAKSMHGATTQRARSGMERRPVRCGNPRSWGIGRLHGGRGG